MAVMAGVLSESRRRTLAALCDTFVPSVGYDGSDETLRAYMARSASDMGVPVAIEALMEQAMLPEEIEGFGLLLDGLGDFAGMPLETRTQALKQISAASPEAKLGLKVFKGLTFLFFYAMPDEQGRNPNWVALGYPGPVSAPPSEAEAPKTIKVEQLGGAEATAWRDAATAA